MRQPPTLSGSYPSILDVLAVALLCAVATAAGAGGGSGAPTLQELKNATYTGLDERSEPVTLVNGRWEGRPYVEGAASRPRVHLLGDYVTYGKLDKDPEEEAVVFLNWSGGGSGELLHLAVVGRSGGTVRNLGTTRIGDRVQIRETRIAEGRVYVDIVRAGAGDAACCPGELATLAWSLGPDGLEKFRDEATGRLTLDSVGGEQWVLRAWALDEPAPAEIEVTLSYHDGRFTGRAGCNQYFAAVSAGKMPGDLAVSPPGSTRMACAAPVMAVEARFLRQLRAVNRFGFMTGQLALGYELRGGSRVMLFDRRVPPNTAEAPGDAPAK